MHAALLLFAALAPADTPKNDDARAVLDQLQGVWKCTGVESGRARGFQGAAGGGLVIQGFAGGAAPVQRIAAFGDVLVIVGNRYAFGQHAGTLKIDTARRPYAVDFEITAGHYKGDTVRGVLELSGDTLQLNVPTMSQARHRPKALKPEEGLRHVLHTFKREKATKEEAAALLADEVANLPKPPDSVLTNELLQKIVDRLDRLERIEKRLDELEKRLPPAK